ncbi:MAG: 4-hydroxy-tetrahydrodipicolinate reductase [Candidatus Omnitrophica bacterium]|nr:4-hydroxy-tetrahydrodipicolinate reductase [Candidatus Omnitrophota bacterium]MBU1784292.1 4-hydroxy-tetrahydrodipicolinate reductase [Candidatus Omnitrophota bacterium]
MLKIGIYGICGKMGGRIAALAAGDFDVKIVSAVERPGHPMIGKKIAGYGITVEETIDGVREIDCMIDFTLPAPAMGHIKSCLAGNIPMVIGTTGFDENDEKAIREASQKIPVVFSPNMAPGVNVLFDIAAKAARALGDDFSIRVDETHHARKKDSPSGTAKMIAKVIKEASGKETPVEAFREGEVIGNHGITFANEFETLEIRHDARTRDVFAAGALKAAKFVSGKTPGLYTMKDVLRLA